MLVTNRQISQMWIKLCATFTSLVTILLRHFPPLFLTSGIHSFLHLRGALCHLTKRWGSCHAEKCKWQSSLGKEERVRAEVETLATPLTEAITPRDPGPHISGWTLAPWPHQRCWVPQATHTHTHLRHPLARRQPLPGDCISVSLWGGLLVPWGKAEKARRLIPLWNVNVEQSRLNSEISNMWSAVTGNSIPFSTNWRLTNPKNKSGCPTALWRFFSRHWWSWGLIPACFTVYLPTKTSICHSGSSEKVH